MAFVHLHNHTDFSILDGATRVDDLVGRAVELGMPAVALTDHGYMFGVPNFDLACRGFNTAQADFKQWSHDVECFTKDWELEEPEADPEDAEPYDGVRSERRPSSTARARSSFPRGEGLVRRYFYSWR